MKPRAITRWEPWMALAQDIFQPEATAKVELIEGFVDDPWASTTIEVLGGDALLALPAAR